MSIQKQSQIVLDMEKSLKGLEYIDEVRVVQEEKNIGNRILHAKDLIPTMMKTDRVKVDTPKSELLRQSERIESSLPLAISHGDELKRTSSSPTTLIDVLLNAAKLEDKGIIYVLDNGDEIETSYRQLFEQAKRLLKGLRNMGIKPQDRVIFQFQKNQNYVPMFWACVLGGFITVPVATSTSYAEKNADTMKLYNIWNMLDKPVIITDEDLLEEVNKLSAVWETEEFVISTAEQLMNNDEEQEFYAYQEEDFVLYLLTSGSTGLPKCVQHRNASLVARSMATAQFNQFDSEEVLLCWMPLEHVGGLVMYHILGVYLACQQILPRVDSFISQPLNWLHWMDKYKATLTWAPNFAFSLVNDQEKAIEEGSWDLSSVKHILNGGEAIVAKTAKRFLSILRKHQLRDDCMYPSFGMSETSSGIVFSKTFRSKPQSGVHYVDKISFETLLRFVDDTEKEHICFTEVGGPIPGVSVRIVDDNNQLLHENHIGRVQVTGPTIMAGYYQNQEANQEAFIGDGWFFTGDLGFLNEGRLTVTGRQKDIIIMNGKNYYNYEIESLVESVYGVQSTFVAAAAFIDTSKSVEELAIFFTPINDIDERFLGFIITEIRRTVSRNLGITPKHIIPIKKETFSKTESGKIQRNKFTERLYAGEFDEIMKQIETQNEDPHQTFPEWMYARKWEERPISVLASPLPQETYLIFRDKLGLGDQWSALSQNGSSTMIIVDQGESFKKRGEFHYEINQHEQKDYQLLCEELKKESVTIHHVLHLWTYQEDLDEAKKELSYLKESQFLGSFSLIFLLQALHKEVGMPKTLTFVSSNVFSLENPEHSAYEKATIPGIIKTMKHEFPNTIAKFVDIDTNHPPYHPLQALQAEQGLPDEESVVIYSKGKRFVPKLQQVNLQEANKKPLPLVEKGFYVVTGGLGGVGKQIAHYLIQKLDANILLLGKTALPSATDKNIGTQSERYRALRELEKLTTRENQIIYKSTDLSDVTVLEEAIHESMLGMNAEKVDGIIHLAGVYYEKPLLEESIESLEHMYESKVAGTYLLGKLVEKYPEAILVTSSSSSGLLSGYGVGAYTSANMFVETFTDYVAQKRDGVQCFAWSLWNDIGLGQQFTDMKDLLIRKGHQPISPQKGIFSFEVGLMLEHNMLYIGLNKGVSEIATLCSEVVEKELVTTVYFSTTHNQFSLSEMYNTIRLHTIDEKGHSTKVIFRQVDQLHSDQAEDHLVSNNRRVEEEIKQLWSEILQVDQLQAFDSFFDLGGSSLKATQLLSSVQSRFGVAIPLKVFFENPTIKGLIHRMGNVAGIKANVMRIYEPAKKREKIIDLSSSQRGQWYLYQTRPDSPFYNITFTLTFEENVNRQALLKSIQAVIQSQEALRSEIRMIEDDPKLFIHDTYVVGIPIIDLSSYPWEQKEQKLAALIDTEANTPFQMMQESLSRFTLIHVGDNVHILLGSMHHIISDGWSIHVFTKELLRFYKEIQENGVIDRKELDYTYTNYLLDQKEWLTKENPEYADQLYYWKENLATETAPLTLPIQLSRPAIQSYQGMTIEQLVTQELTQNIMEASKHMKSTPYMFLLSTFAALLFRYSGQDTFRLGTVLANRNMPHTEKIIGYLANTVTLSFDFKEELTFDQLLDKVRGMALEAHDNQNVPLETVLRELQVRHTADMAPLFQIVFTMQNAVQHLYQNEQIKTYLDIVSNKTSKYDLSLHVYEEEHQLRLKLEFNTDLFEEEAMKTLLGHYLNFIQVITNDKVHTG
ncbi:SDR family NAD(P)-dependent oxidoreductase [Brevibacillus halotolerans]|nr:SDR family NAD(P)-dependent oxidoreductase [Brevibacillus halotolerans]